MESPYKKLARKIGNRVDDSWFCCCELRGENKESFVTVFEPTASEQRIYNSLSIAWMGSWDQKTPRDNEDRILALLFMDEWIKDSDISEVQR